MNQIKESASVKDVVINPFPSTGAVPAVGWLKEQQREEGRAGKTQICSGSAAHSLCLGLVAFIGTNLQNFYWRMGKSNSLLESSSPLVSLYLLVSVYGMFLSISVCSTLIISVSKGANVIWVLESTEWKMALGNFFKCKSKVN